MSATIIDGKKLSLNIQDQLKRSLISQKLVGGIKLAVILVGKDPASRVYVKNKTNACQYVGINVEEHFLDESISQDELIRVVHQLNNDDSVHGILLQLPLPEQLSKPMNSTATISTKILEQIHPNKDVDGFHPYNMGRLAQREPNITPCTPKGIIRCLEYYNIPMKTKNATIVGASNIVGRPLALELLIAGATVTVCHKFTDDLKQHCLNADILCSAVGLPGLIKGDFIKKGATVVDVGITRLQDGTLAGDVDFDNALERAKFITPVPGGIGPMTVAMLLENTIQCYELLTHSKVLDEIIQ